MWTSVDYKPITPCLLEGLVELLFIKLRALELSIGFIDTDFERIVG